MKYLALLLIAVICQASASPNLSVLKSSVLRDGQANPLVTEIMSLLEVGAPTDQVSRLVEKVAKTFENEQNASNELNEQEQTECAALKYQKSLEIATLQGELFEANNTWVQRFHAWSQKKAALTPVINQAQAELDTVNHQLEINEENRQRVTTRRQEDHDEYNQKVHDHEDAIDALEEIRDKLASSSLATNKAAAALMEITQGYSEKVAKYLELPSLAEISLLTDPEDVDKLTDLVNRLLARIQDLLRELHENEVANKARFEKEIADLAAEKDLLLESKAALEEELAILRGELALYKGKHDEALAVRDNFQKLVDENSDLLIQIISNCLEKLENYLKSSSRRIHDIVALYDVELLLNVRLTKGDYSFVGSTGKYQKEEGDYAIWNGKAEQREFKVGKNEEGLNERQ